jgi:hypothetical protein
MSKDEKKQFLKDLAIGKVGRKKEEGGGRRSEKEEGG